MQINGQPDPVREERVRPGSGHTRIRGRLLGERPPDNYARAITQLSRKVSYVADPGVFMLGFVDCQARTSRNTSPTKQP